MTKRRHKTSAYLFKRFNHVILNKYLNIAVKLFHLINLDLRARFRRDFSFILFPRLIDGLKFHERSSLITGKI